MPIVIPCQRCLKDYHPKDNHTHIDSGLYLHADGYYNGFNDNFNETDQEKYVWICHDCSVKLYRSIPAWKDAQGLHPNQSEVPGKWCCEFAWDLEDGQIIHAPTKDNL